MIIQDLKIEGLKVIEPARFDDGRGFFSETFSEKTWADAGFSYKFVQDNHSLSIDLGTLRGLHFQIVPFAQTKLVRVLRGSIFDVAVDLRRNSPTFGKYVSVELSHKNWRQYLIPTGFAHGFITLEPNTEVAYKVSNYYSPAHDYGIAWDDPDIGIKWPIYPSNISEKDNKLPRLRELKNFF